MQITKIKDALEALTKELTLMKEYDYASVRSMRFDANGAMTISYSCEDSFQNDLPDEYKYYNGNYESVYFDSPEEFEIAFGNRRVFEKIPSRAKRERAILTRIASNMKTVSATMTSALAQNFAKVFLEESAPLFLLLEDQSE